MPELREVASGLEFPEGPVVMADGSVLVVEMAAGRITRIAEDGGKDVVAEPGGGPNGLAVGPDGHLFACNNGGAFHIVDMGGISFPHQPSPNYVGNGRIERIDLATGAVDVLYSECEGQPLRAPNDLVFDAAGNLWFTDHGYAEERRRDRTGVYWARPDGSEIREVAFPLDHPNGIGLSPDGTRLYVAETLAANIWWWDVAGEGELVQAPGVVPHGGQLLTRMAGLQALDSLAVDSEGHVCAGTLLRGGITRIAPDGGDHDFFETGDLLTTNVAFGGPDRRTAFATLSGTGRVVAFEWPVAGLELAYGA